MFDIPTYREHEYFIARLLNSRRSDAGDSVTAYRVQLCKNVLAFNSRRRHVYGPDMSKLPWLSGRHWRHYHERYIHRRMGQACSHYRHIRQALSKSINVYSQFAKLPKEIVVILTHQEFPVPVLDADA